MAIMNVQNSLESYAPSTEEIQVVRATPIVLLVGIMSAGKDTLQRQLLKSDDYHSIITHTTRPPLVNSGVL